MADPDLDIHGDIHDPAFVAALFDRCSAGYRRWSMLASFGLVDRWRRLCVDRLVGQRQVGRLAGGALTPAPGPAPRVLDLMAGAGEVWPHLFAVLPEARITAVDISGEMHRRALEVLHEARASKIEHHRADVLETPLGEADLVISCFGLKTLSPAQQARLATRIAGALRPGGAFALIEASAPRGRGLGLLWRLYLGGVLPLMARLVLHGARDFAMIGTYTRAFGDCSAVAGALRAEGLIVSVQRHMGGAATSVAGVKPIAPPGTEP